MVGVETLFMTQRRFFIKIFIGILALFSFFSLVITYFEIVRFNGSSSDYFEWRKHIDGDFVVFLERIVVYSLGFTIPFLLFQLIFSIWSSTGSREIYSKFIDKPMLNAGIFFISFSSFLLYAFFFDSFIALNRIVSEIDDNFLTFSIIIASIILTYLGFTFIRGEVLKAKVKLKNDREEITQNASR